MEVFRISTLLYATVSATIIFLLWQLIRKFLLDACSPGLLWCLGMLVLLRFVIPVPADFSVFATPRPGVSEAELASQPLLYNPGPVPGNLVYVSESSQDWAMYHGFRETLSSPRIANILVLAWIIGAIAVTVFSILVYLRTSLLLTRSATAAPESLMRVARKAINDLEIQRPVTICTTPHVRVAAMTGIIRPRIFVHPDLPDWQPSEIDHVIRHELAHIKRCDVLWTFLTLVARSLHWFNPVAWILTKQIHHDMEMACDQLSMRGRNMFERCEFAKTLLNVQQPHAVHRAIPLSFESAAGLETRVKMLLREPGWSSRSYIAMASMIAISLLALVPISSARQTSTPRVSLPSADWEWAFDPGILEFGVPDLDAPPVVYSAFGYVIMTDRMDELNVRLHVSHTMPENEARYRPVIVPQNASPIRGKPIALGSSGNTSFSVFSFDATEVNQPGANLAVEVLSTDAQKRVTRERRSEARNQNLQVLPVAVLNESYSFELTSTSGQPIRSQTLLGKYVLIDCWGSSYLSSIKKMPRLTRLATDYPEELQIIGVNFDQSRADLEKQAADYGICWPQVFVSPDPQLRTMWREAAEIQVIPQLFLLDPDGVLIDSGNHQVIEKLEGLLNSVTSH